MGDMLNVCFLSCKDSLVPTAFQLPAAEICGVYIDSFYLFRCEVTMNTVGVGVDKPALVFAVIV